MMIIGQSGEDVENVGALMTIGSLPCPHQPVIVIAICKSIGELDNLNTIVSYRVQEQVKKQPFHWDALKWE